jgi:hypothetical protein
MTITGNGGIAAECLDFFRCRESRFIAMNEKNPPELRARLFIELAQYIYPKRKAVDTAVEKASVTNFITKLDPGSSDDSNQPDPGA